MNLTITCDAAPPPHSHITVMRLEGSISRVQGVDREDEFSYALAGEPLCSDLLLDMRIVTGGERVCLAEFLSIACTRIDDKNGQFKILAPEDEELNRLVRAISKFEVYSSKAEALRSFGPARLREERPRLLWFGPAY